MHDFYSEINPVYYFYLKMNIFSFTQICGGFLIIFNKFFYYLLLPVFRCRIKQKFRKSIHGSQKI